MKKLLTVMCLALLAINITTLCGLCQEDVAKTNTYETTSNETSINASTQNEERRQYERYNNANLTKPVKITSNEAEIGDLIDISRGGVAIKHNNTLKEGAILPVRITYNEIQINTEIKIVSATETRAGAQYINTCPSLANKLLYLSIFLENDNNLLKTKLSS